MRKHQLGEVSTSPEKVLRLVERLQMQVYAPYAVEKDVGSFQRCPNGTSYEALSRKHIDSEVSTLVSVARVVRLIDSIFTVSMKKFECWVEGTLGSPTPEEAMCKKHKTFHV